MRPVLTGLRERHGPLARAVVLATLEWRYLAPSAQRRANVLERMVPYPAVCLGGQWTATYVEDPIIPEFPGWSARDSKRLGQAALVVLLACLVDAGQVL